MLTIIFSFMVIFYLFCVHLNYIWFHGFMDGRKDLIYIFYGPYATFLVVKKKIRKHFRKKKMKKEIEKIMKELPKFLKEYNITVEDDGAEK